MHPTRCLLPLLATALIAGCGGGDDDAAMPPPEPPPTARAVDFPRLEKGANLQELVDRYPEGPNLASTASLFDVGANRMAFGLFDDARKQIAGAAVAVYAAREDGTRVRGPFVARPESLKVKPQFESQNTAQEPDSTSAVYVVDLRLPSKGRWVLVGLAKLDGRMVATAPTGIEVAKKGPKPPDVGDRVPRIHTPTLASVGGDASKISTRVPPAEDMLRTDFYDVVGKKPAVLVFATPALCQSRLCGPVVDVAAQVKAGVGEDVAFIHQEIYKDNKPPTTTPQVSAFRLPTEPWVFVVDRRGRVSTRIEGAFSVGELERAVAKVRQ